MADRNLKSIAGISLACSFLLVVSPAVSLAGAAVWAESKRDDASISAPAPAGAPEGQTFGKAWMPEDSPEDTSVIDARGGKAAKENGSSSKDSANKADDSASKPAKESQSEVDNDSAIFTPDNRKLAPDFEQKIEAQPADMLGAAAASAKPQQLTTLEERVFGQGNKAGHGTTEQRLSALESFALGRPQTGDVTARLARLTLVLDGKATAASVSQPAPQESSKKANLAVGIPDRASDNQKAPDKISAPPVASDISPLASAAPPSTKVLRGRVDTLAAAYAAIGLRLEKNSLPTPVTVTINGRAMKAGVMDGDHLLHAEVNIDTITLAIERNNQRFILEVPLTDQAKVLTAAATQRESPKSTPTVLHAAATVPNPMPVYKHLTGTAGLQADWNVLKKYNIVVLMDVSGSMKSPINSGGGQPFIGNFAPARSRGVIRNYTPGAPNAYGSSPIPFTNPSATYGSGAASGGLSKFDWCKQQIYSLAQEAQKMSGSAFDFGTYESHLILYPNCTPQGVIDVLAARSAGGGTDLSDAMDATIDSRYLKDTSKPFLIVVVTDALVGQVNKIEQTMINAAQQARKPYDLRVVFLQVGDAKSGKDVVDFLDSQPVVDGAPYDVCNSVSWDQLSQLGLRSGLLAAMSAPASTGAISDPAQKQTFDNFRVSGQAGPGAHFGQGHFPFGGGGVWNNPNMTMPGISNPNLNPTPSSLPSRFPGGLNGGGAVPLRQNYP